MNYFLDELAYFYSLCQAQLALYHQLASELGHTGCDHSGIATILAIQTFRAAITAELRLSLIYVIHGHAVFGFCIIILICM